MALLNKCCCFDLRTAGKIIGGIGASLQVIVLLFCLFLGTAAIALLTNRDQLIQSLENSEDLTQEQRNKLEDIKHKTSNITPEQSATAYVFLGLLIVFCIINLVTCVLLIIGSNNGKANYIIPYLVLDMIVIVLFIVSIPFSGDFISPIIYVALKIYLWIVLYSLYSSLKNNTLTTNTQGVVYSQGGVYAQPPQQFVQQQYVPQQSVPQQFGQQQYVPQQSVPQQFVPQKSV